MKSIIKTVLSGLIAGVVMIFLSYLINGVILGEAHTNYSFLGLKAIPYICQDY
ncbi:unnamed protein product [marine sediment metagenome]|uniref:Uncharacterized protein n=1 Tax=marine sediment metagenome TaxID=412755 RepID=X1L9Q5_9ZZZZ